MHTNTAIRNLIREEKTYQIDSVIAAGGKEGMRTMDQSLFDLVKAGRIDRDTALTCSVHTEALENRLDAEKL
jgi:twitching motility protein PilT